MPSSWVAHRVPLLWQGTPPPGVVPAVSGLLLIKRNIWQGHLLKVCLFCSNIVFYVTFHYIGNITDSWWTFLLSYLTLYLVFILPNPLFVSLFKLLCLFEFQLLITGINCSLCGIYICTGTECFHFWFQMIIFYLLMLHILNPNQEGHHLDRQLRQLTLTNPLLAQPLPGAQLWMMKVSVTLMKLSTCVASLLHCQLPGSLAEFENAISQTFSLYWFHVNYSLICVF